jgi:Ecdysteroid kinase-like family
MEIPNGPEAMTPEWLTQALQQNETITRARVLSFQTTTIGADGAGVSGEMVRVNLTYDLDEPSAPRSLIAKFHAQAEPIRTAVNSLGFYENEFQFYKHAAGRTGLPTPCCYYGDYEKGGRVVLLLEDLAPARCLGWDMSPSQVELAVQHIARFHAFWWQHPGIGEILQGQDPVALQNLITLL